LSVVIFKLGVLWMAGKAEQYKVYAAECLRIAQETADPGQKARLLEMAEAWQRLGEAATKRENSA
jgi:hypothetical protein